MTVAVTAEGPDIVGRERPPDRLRCPRITHSRRAACVPPTVPHGATGAGSWGAVTARRLSDLNRRGRRRAITRTLAEIVAAWVILIGLFYLVPVGAGTGPTIVARIVFSVALLTFVLTWQVRRIARSDVPELRAATALGVIIPLFFVLFATIYLSMSNASTTTFYRRPRPYAGASTSRSRCSPRWGSGTSRRRPIPARIVVSIQMILDLIIIGGAVRVLFNAAQAGPQERRARTSGET